MPTLNWIGKDKVINHHLEVSFRVLEHKYGFRSDNAETGLKHIVVIKLSTEIILKL